MSVFFSFYLAAAGELCVKFRLCAGFVSAEGSRQSITASALSCLHCAGCVRRLRGPTRPASRRQVFANNGAALLIFDELTLGLVMWIRKPRVSAAPRASWSLPPLRSG